MDTLSKEGTVETATIAAVTLYMIVECYNDITPVRSEDISEEHYGSIPASEISALRVCTNVFRSSPPTRLPSMLIFSRSRDTALF